MTNTTLFDDNSNTQDRYSSWDLDALKRKATEADNHIELIEAENKHLRELAKTNTTMDEVIARLDLLNLQTPPNFQPTTPANNAAERNNSLDVVTKTDVATLVAQTLETLQKENSAKDNVSKVRQELTKIWGDNISTKLKEKATELNISERFLAQVAESSPTAFLKLVLEDKPTTNPNTHTPPSTTFRAIPSQDQPLTTWKQYSKAMKDTPHLRHDPIFQRQLHETAEKQGASFWS